MMTTNQFLGELLVEVLVLPVLDVHLLRLLVIVHGQFLQGLQHLLHLVLGRIVLGLDTRHLLLELLVVAASPRDQLLLLEHLLPELLDELALLVDLIVFVVQLLVHVLFLQFPARALVIGDGRHRAGYHLWVREGMSSSVRGFLPLFYL